MRALLDQLRRWFPLPLESVNLRERGHVRMLELTHQRLVLGICAMPLLGIPFTLWFQGLGRDPRGMLAWTVLYAVMALMAVVQAKRLRRELEAGGVDMARWLARWRPAVRFTSLAHAVGMAALGLIVLLTPGRASFDFVLLLHVSLAVVIVGSATFQLPSMGMFLRFYGVGWGVTTVLLPLVLSQWPSLLGGPPHATRAGGGFWPWPFIIPMSLLLLIALYRQAVVAHNFFLKQVQLEEESGRLARDYQAAKEEAERALQAKNQFVSTASHDLRQPLHAMGFLIESIAHRNQDAALLPALQDLRHSVRSLSLMFNSLLDLSRIENGAIDVSRLPVALNPLLRDVATVFQEEAGSRGLALRLRAARGGATVWADPVLLRQSLVNLVHNALRYTARGGVLLCARQRGAHWRLEVWDTGMGVPREDRERIFQPFYRHGQARHVDSAGHGLGLAVVARCAELMGIQHGLESVEGRGSRFWLQLDAAEPSDQGLSAPAQAGVPALAALRGACLVVEDDPQVVVAWTRLMLAWGVDVCCVETGAQAQVALDEGFRPHAILCDQRLRGGESGVEVLKALLTRCPEAGGAVVSGEFHSDELQQAQQDGYLVLRKPLDVVQLHALLGQWLPA